MAGDTTLETVAERLRKSLPENSIVGRLAGDEFAVMVNGLWPTGSGVHETRGQRDGIHRSLRSAGRLGSCDGPGPGPFRAPWH